MLWHSPYSVVLCSYQKWFTSLLRFPFLSHVQVSRVRCHLFIVWNVYSVVFVSQCCFRVIFHPLMLMLSVLFLVAVISRSPRVFMQLSSRCIDSSRLSGILVSPLPPLFLDTSSLSTSFLACKALSMVMTFFVLRSLRWSSSLVNLKEWSSSVLGRGQPRCLSFWWDFCYVVWFQVVFSFSRCIISKFFLSSRLFWWYPFSLIPSICKFPFLQAFWFFLDLIVLFLIIIIILLFWEFFILTFADGFPLGFEWQ